LNHQGKTGHVLVSLCKANPHIFQTLLLTQQVLIKSLPSDEETIIHVRLPYFTLQNWSCLKNVLGKCLQATFPALFQENHLSSTHANSFAGISVISKECQAINIYA